MKVVIINSKGHWIHGWFTSPSDLKTGIRVLQKAGLEVITTEVENVAHLEKTLDGVSSDTLIWPNAYFVNAGEEKVVWINEYIEDRNLPFVGSRTQTLQNVLKKNVCQTILKEKLLPIPAFTVVTRENTGDIYALISQNISDDPYPVVLKPTSESGSIGVRMARDHWEARKYALQILKDFPHSDVIIEEFLPSDDITCGFLQLGDKALLLPTAYIVKSLPGKDHILSREERLRAWDDTDKIQPCITDNAILNQLKAYIAPVAAALKIRGLTRIDGRLDKNGILRFFDVNGLPALCYPEGVMVKQCFSCFPGYAPMEVFAGLIHTIIYSALLQYGMAVPEVMQKHNLFMMDSDLVIRSEVLDSGTSKQALIL